jgi:hypothetical protein
MERVAIRRFGATLAPFVVQAWREWSAAFREFPYDGAVVYNAPMQFGPSNLLWAKATGYRATMVGFPYDDLDGWRGPYPAEVFIAQLTKVADGFERALASLRGHFARHRASLSRKQAQSLEEELQVAHAAGIHFRSTANQARFVRARTAGEDAKTRGELQQVLRDEIDLAKQLYAIQTRDSRIGFEASNHYYYVPLDLVEKVLNCQQLLDAWPV